MSASPYLLTADVAERYSVSERWVRERTRTSTIPHRRLPGSRRCLFLAEHLQRWEDGAELEVREIAGGGRIVTPRAAA